MSETTVPPCSPGHHFGRCFSLSRILYRVLTLMLLLPGTTSQKLRPPGSPLSGTGHLVSPTCPRAGAALTRGSWSPASCWCRPWAPSPWRGAPSRDGSFTRSVSVPRLLPIPRKPFAAPTLPLPHGSARPPGRCWGTSQTRHDSWRFLSTLAPEMNEGPTRRLSPFKEPPPIAVLGCSAVRRGGRAGRSQVPGTQGAPGPQIAPSGSACAAPGPG